MNARRFRGAGPLRDLLAHPVRHPPQDDEIDGGVADRRGAAGGETRPLAARPNHQRQHQAGQVRPRIVHEPVRGEVDDVVVGPASTTRAVARLASKSRARRTEPGAAALVSLPPPRREYGSRGKAKPFVKPRPTSRAAREGRRSGCAAVGPAPAVNAHRARRAGHRPRTPDRPARRRFGRVAFSRPSTLGNRWSAASEEGARLRWASDERGSEQAGAPAARFARGSGQRGETARSAGCRRRRSPRARVVEGSASGSSTRRVSWVPALSHRRVRRSASAAIGGGGAAGCRETRGAAAVISALGARRAECIPLRVMAQP